jgi:ubiquinone/menaquinone biosynthesis C-methylase UbiE
MTDTVQRFSNRVENYIKYRPDYPREIIAHLTQNCSLRRDSIIADIGCGPGISSRMFLENGNRCLGVEPNAAMRLAAAQQMAAYTAFSLVDGTSEQTTLPDASVDMVIAAQAFHWFDAEKTRPEFQRILTPGGHIVLMWNERQLGTTQFLIEYEAFLLKYATDYTKVRHENVDAESLEAFFRKPYDAATFQNVQVFDFDGLKGRLFSASYMPSETDEISGAMIDELTMLFAKHNENGRIRVFYDTNVYTSQV